MIDVTDYVYHNGGNIAGNDSYDELLQWCNDNVGERIDATNGMKYQALDVIWAGKGWYSGIFRTHNPERNQKFLHFYFAFDDELDELQFKLAWPILTSHLQPSQSKQV
jgi:hypothetical protein